jgi:hypothetical protein
MVEPFFGQIKASRHANASTAADDQPRDQRLPMPGVNEAVPCAASPRGGERFSFA